MEIYLLKSLTSKVTYNNKKMSLRDLLPEGTFDEILEEAHLAPEDLNTDVKNDNEPVKVKCPTCGKEVIYDKSNPFRPFCSQRCRMAELGAWVSNKRFIKGTSLDQDEDGGDINNVEFRSCQDRD